MGQILHSNIPVDVRTSSTDTAALSGIAAVSWHLCFNQ